MMDGLTINDIDGLTTIGYDELTTSGSYSYDADEFGPKRDSLYIVVPITVVYLLIFLTGLIGNVSTCIVIARNKAMHTATNYYLFSLAISDLLLLISGLPQEVYSIWSRYPYIFGYTFCVLRGLFSETSANATVLTITAFTVERYVAICHPFLSHTMSKLSRAVKLIVCIWIVAICFAIPQALQFGITPMRENDPQTEMCHVIAPIIEHSFEVSTLLFFVAPMTLITVLYVLIGVRLKSSSSMITRSQGDSTRSSISRNVRLGVTATRKTSGRSTHSQSSRRVLKMLVAVVVAFFICWAPFHAQRLIAIYVPFPEDDEESIRYLRIYEIVTYISGVLYYVSTTINPLLYNIMSNKFREAFKETFTRCCLSKSRRPEHSYSVLSRSAPRGHESTTDSGREEPSIQTHSSVVQKNSIDSVSPYPTGRRYYMKQKEEKKRSNETNGHYGFVVDDRKATIGKNSDLTANYDNIDPHRHLVTIQVKNKPGKFVKFVRLFHCIARKTLDDGKRKRSTTGVYCATIQNENVIILDCVKSGKDDTFSITNSDISNSSLKDMENCALRAELENYMCDIICK